MTRPSVGVVLCTYTLDRIDQVVAAVRSAREQTRPVDDLVVVVDGDETLAEAVRGHLPGERVHALGTHRGVSVARNTGVELLSTDLVFFLDDDAVADPAWVACLVPYLEDPAVLGASARSVGAWHGREPAWFPDEYLWTVGCSYRGMPTRPAPVRNFFGGCAGLRREVFLAAGGFADGIGHGDGTVGGGEEAEFCLRVRDAHPGAEFWYVPGARIDHHVPVERMTFGYLLRRCFDEGVMKVDIARMRADDRGTLGPERRFALALPLAALRYLATPGRRAAAPALAAATAAVLAGMARARVSRRPVEVVPAGGAAAEDGGGGAASPGHARQPHRGRRSA